MSGDGPEEWPEDCTPFSRAPIINLSIKLSNAPPLLRGVLNKGFPKLLKKMPENENADNFQKTKKSS